MRGRQFSLCLTVVLAGIVYSSLIRGDGQFVYCQAPANVGVGCKVRCSNSYKCSQESNFHNCNASDDILSATPLLAKPIPDEVMLIRIGYTVSYNTSTREPNYVAWVLSPGRLQGVAQRAKSFSEDEELACGERARLSDYYNTGYDRGHMCPAGDNKWSVEAMNQSFLLSNVCPQRHTLNSGGWNSLEQACRKWIRRNKRRIYIVAGPIFDVCGKYTRKGRRVRVPDRFFKALICIDGGEKKGIAFIFDNNTQSQSPANCVTTIDRVEEITGYDLFCKLGKSLQTKLEAQSDLKAWR